MKYFTLLLSTLFISLSLFAQTNIQLQINHKLGNQDFAFYNEVNNNLGDNFDFKRCQYYLSGFELIHDGGTVTPISDLYLLVNAGNPTLEELGNFDITNLEGIRFYIGVNEAANHLDPAAYASDHPLAPQNPSMHWGWASGYRFIAIEGKAGNNLNEVWEIHGLGDENYFQEQLDLELTAEDNQIIIDLDADYIRALENIAVASGVIEHGFNDEAKEALENFSLYVFSPAGTISSNTNVERSIAFELAPNPAQDWISVKLNVESPELVLVLYNQFGQQISSQIISSNYSALDLSQLSAGQYLISLSEAGRILKTQKFIKQ